MERIQSIIITARLIHLALVLLDSLAFLAGHWVRRGLGFALLADWLEMVLLPALPAGLAECRSFPWWDGCVHSTYSSWTRRGEQRVCLSDHPWWRGAVRMTSRTLYRCRLRVAVLDQERRLDWPSIDSDNDPVMHFNKKYDRGEVQFSQ